MSIPSTSQNQSAASQAFKDYFPKITEALDIATTQAAQLPPKSDLSFHRTLDRKFGKELDVTSSRILGLAEKLLKLVSDGGASGSAKVKGKGKVGVVWPKVRRRLDDEDDIIDGYRGAVVDVIDSLLEDADSCLDELNGQKKVAAIAVKPALVAAAGKKLPGPFTKDNRLNPSLIHASSLVKPQKKFPDPVDNSISRGPWRPDLSEKLHAMVPLDFVLPPVEEPVPDLRTLDSETDQEEARKNMLKREKDLKARNHPYYYETKHLPYPTSMFQTSSPVSPKSFEDTPFVFVDTREKLAEMVEKLKIAKEIAVDLEHHSMRSYDGFTCLMQVSTREGDWVVDTLSLRGALRDEKLGGVMADPSIVKVFHGADSDILWLQRDFGIFVVNLFDTYHATKVLDFPSFSLASLLSLYCDFQADKRYQMADWRIRPLPQEMLFYARSDTHFLLYIYDNLRNALLERSSRAPTPTPSTSEEGAAKPASEIRRMNPQQAIREVLDRSAETALKLFERDGYDEITGKGMGGWATLGKKLGSKEIMQEEVGWVFRKLHAWRDGVARAEDESTHYVLPNQLLISLSFLRPQTVPVLLRSIGGRASIASKRAGEILQAIQNGKADFTKYQKELEATSQEPTAAGSSSQVLASSTSSTTPRPKRKVVSSLATPSGTKDTSTPKAPALKIVNDVWDSIGTAKTPVQRKIQSSMFGSTIETPTNDQNTPKTKAKATSSLFGSSLGTAKETITATSATQPARQLSPSFVAIQRTIHGELSVQTPVSNLVTPSDASTLNAPVKSEVKEVHSTAIPEQVPFIPQSSRVPAPAREEPTTVAPVAEKEEKTEKDAIVVVKKKRKQKRRQTQDETGDVGRATGEEAEIGGSADKKLKLTNGEALGVTSSSSTPTPTQTSITTLTSVTTNASASKGKGKKDDSQKENGAIGDVLSPPLPSTATKGESSNDQSTSSKKSRNRKKIDPSKIPVFDYSKEPNLLDDPKLVAKKAAAQAGPAVSVSGKEKVKKPKIAKAPVIDTSLFRKPPMDPSQPKAGNKSGTFSH